jgi:Peptidase_C39 like family
MPGRLNILGRPQLLALRDDKLEGEGGEERVLAGFSLNCQELTNWCWASVAQAILRASVSEVTQRGVAVDHIRLNRPTEPEGNFTPTGTNAGICGDRGCNSAFNAPHSLRRLLAERNLLRSQGYIIGDLSFDVITREIRANRPVPCRIKWTNADGAHFVCLGGYAVDGDVRYVYVHDPLFPGIARGEASARAIRFEAFLRTYPLGTVVGRQTHAYLVM